jgi:hypothetical protein
MSSFVQFAFESTLIIGVFILLHGMLFRNETNFSLTRKIMLCGLGLSVSLPLMDIQLSPIAGMSNLHVDVSAIWLPEVMLVNLVEEIDSAPISTITAVSILQLTYVLGVIFFTIKFGIQLMQLVKILRLPATHLHGYRIIEVKGQEISFSFFNTIVLGTGNTLSLTEKNQILDHEKVHVDQYHSIDIVLLDLMNIVFWFNPLIKIYKNILVQLHEFEADARAVEFSDVDHYCGLMAKVALQSSGIKVASYFHQSLTLKRIKMIKTVRHKTSQWKLALAVLAIASLVITIACEEPEKSDADSKIPGQAMVKFDEFKRIHSGPAFLVEKDSKMNLTLATLQSEYGEILTKETFTIKSNEIVREFHLLEFQSVKNSTNVFTVVDQMPEFPGGFDKLVDFMQANLLMPQTLKSDGKTLVSFIVEKDGSLSEIKVLQGFDSAADEEAVRVVKLFPKWKPGKQQGNVVRTSMVLPVVYKR